jgi:hypothetical protein
VTDPGVGSGALLAFKASPIMMCKSPNAKQIRTIVATCDPPISNEIGKSYDAKHHGSGNKALNQKRKLPRAWAMVLNCTPLARYLNSRSRLNRVTADEGELSMPSSRITAGRLLLRMLASQVSERSSF